MLNRDTTLEKFNDLSNHQIAINNDYFLKKAYFLIDDEQYVEMITVSFEYKDYLGNEQFTQFKILSSQTRELSLSEASRDMREKLLSHDNINIVYKLNEEQARKIVDKFQDELHAVTEEKMKTFN